MCMIYRCRMEAETIPIDWDSLTLFGMINDTLIQLLYKIF